MNTILVAEIEIAWFLDIFLISLLMSDTCVFDKPFNSHEWSKQNFSSQYQFSINQMRDENKETYQFGDN